MSIQDFLIDIGLFINYSIIPFLFALALLFFLFNVIRYFILKGDAEDGRNEAKRLALYGIGAFVLLVSIWGLVNLIASSVGIDDGRSLCPDYLDGWCGDDGSYGGGGYYGDADYRAEWEYYEAESSASWGSSSSGGAAGGDWGWRDGR